jgi:hypothetical protein
MIAGLPADLNSLDTSVEIKILRVVGAYGKREIRVKTHSLFDCSCLKNLKEIRLGMIYRGNEETVFFAEFCNLHVGR